MADRATKPATGPRPGQTPGLSNTRTTRPITTKPGEQGIDRRGLIGKPKPEGKPPKLPDR